MYKFPYYTETDKDKVIAFIQENYFAAITGHGDEYPVATQIPLEIEIKEDGKTSKHKKYCLVNVLYL